MSTRKILKIALITIVFLIVISMMVLPKVVVNYISNNGETLVGRKLSIQDMSVNYFKGKIEVVDFVMFEENKKDSFVSFDTLKVDLKPLRYFSDEINIESLDIDGVSVNLKMKDSVFNFDDIITFFEDNSESSSNEQESSSLALNLSNFNLKNSELKFYNQNLNDLTHLEDLSFFLPHIELGKDQVSQGDFKFNLENGGTVKTNFDYNDLSGDYSAKLVVDKFSLKPYTKYITPYLNINSVNGFLGGDISFKGNVNEIEALLVSGQLWMNDFFLKDNFNQVVLSAENVSAGVSKIDLKNSNYEIDKIKINKSFVDFKLDSISNNLSRLVILENDSNITTKEVDTTGSNLSYIIKDVELKNGKALYTDNLTGEKFEYKLSKVNINSKNISDKAEWLTFNSTMVLNDRGSLVAKLDVKPDDLNSLNLDFTITDFLLSDINVYSKYYMGHSIIRGDMYYKSNTKLLEGDLKSENNLLIKNVSVDNNKKGLYRLPLKFALFILKDKNGDVNLDIPVRGDLNNPSVNVNKIVWKTFKNFIVKVATSPGRSLVNLVGGGAKDIEEVSFEYLDSIPSSKQLKQYDKLLTIESKKPELRTELMYCVDESLQRQAIAKSELGKQYFLETGKNYEDDEDEFVEYLWSKTNIDSIRDSNYDVVYQNVKETSELDSIVESYNTTLIKKTQEYFKKVNDSSNIKVFRSDRNDPNNIGSNPKFYVKFSIDE